MPQFTESIVEEAALAWLNSLGYAVLHGPEIAAGMPAVERSDANYCDVVLEVTQRQQLPWIADTLVMADCYAAVLSAVFQPLLVRAIGRK